MRVCGRNQGAKKLKSIRIKGFQGTSLLDFPGRVASLVFTGHCNLTCPFCHNAGLVLDPESYPDYPLDELLADLKKREGFIDGVVISGGEPTIDAGLPAFVSLLKERGLQVKLDSNGLAPDVISALLKQQLVDYYAIDIKTSLNRYNELHTMPVAIEALRKTVAILKQASVEVEFRTTCIPPLVAAPEIDAMGELLQGAPLWVLQQYVPLHAMIEEWQHLDAYHPQRLYELAEQAGKYVDQVQVRGI
ncbi:anaerobic ribonucleoside-triphosphate reductase activating protein [uncultured Desulfuromusa sp.]|uniref:anaerobic ribonucleoside-triphosphate reductase activating protein n=1 Tax=uncultured Desulfuromusa sp. TaxID=219183 RepID=UPI002AA90098|nr:anaerobic ribonucleoside-triphosphate reductase activating protein [uncultured Desulfuromusa sp.]